MKKSSTSVELYYWPGIPGRGEFVRLLLEDAGAAYVDVVRDRKNGMEAMTRILNGEERGALPFAPPFIKVGGAIVSQTANILAFLSAYLGLSPRNEARRAEMNQIQLTIADLVGEVHDTHHPIAGSLYYEDQKAPAKRRARNFVSERLPKYLRGFERILARNGGKWLVGSNATYIDLSLFHVVAGLRYAFPNAMQQNEPRFPLIVALHDRVAARPAIARYLKSRRRQAFNKQGIFRHYPELDAKPKTAKQARMKR